jgi:ABC-type cobalamin/Fe3+-siderophores transport system ATPase subunit
LNHDEVAYLPQNLEAPPFLNIMEVTYLGFYANKMSHEEKMRAANALLEQCGIVAIQDRRFTDVSAGERQRTWLAFALAQSKDVILMDEPLSSIDIPSRKSFYRLLQEIVLTAKTIVVVTHDIDMAILYSSRIIGLEKGVKTFEGDPLLFQQKYPYDRLMSSPHSA